MTAKDVTAAGIAKDLALTAAGYVAGVIGFCLIAAAVAAAACLLVVCAPFWPKMVRPLRCVVRVAAEFAAGKPA